MQNSRRLATIGLSFLAVGSLFAGTAGAQQATAQGGSWGGTASAEAMTIKIGGQTLTTSAATAELRAALAKAFSGQKIVTAPLANEGTAKVEGGPGTDEKKVEKCFGSDLAVLPGVHRLDVTCGTAKAVLSADGGSARGLGAMVVLEPSASEVLSTLQLQGPAQEATTAVVDGLNPLVEGLTGTPIGELVGGTTQTVEELLTKVLTLKSTARIVIAPALAEVKADATKVVAHGEAQGIRIELLAADATAATNGLLPDDLTANEPLVTITIGSAKFTDTANKDGSGENVVEVQKALATVSFGSNVLVEALGLPSNTITVEAGQSFCVPGLEGTPLETCVTVANAGVDANGNSFADATSVQLFKGISGGIDLATGRVSGGTATGAAPAPVAAPAAAAPAGELPRTGGPDLLPIIGGGLLALALATRRFAFGRR